jgi:hypothetical protein
MDNYMMILDHYIEAEDMGMTPDEAYHYAYEMFYQEEEAAEHGISLCK